MIKMHWNELFDLFAATLPPTPSLHYGGSQRICVQRADPKHSHETASAPAAVISASIGDLAVRETSWQKYWT